MQYINIDIAIEIASWLIKVNDITAYAATTKVLHAAISYLISIARIRVDTVVRICKETGIVRYCGSRTTGSNHYCFINHNVRDVPIGDIKIRCTFGQFLSEILPHTITRTYACSPYAKFKMYRCVVCNLLRGIPNEDTCNWRVILTMVNDIIYVHGVFECFNCHDNNTIITQNDNDPWTGGVCIKKENTPDHDNLEAYKKLKKFYWQNRRKKYRFVFV